MLHFCIYICVLVTAKADGLGTEISDQLDATKGYCIDAPIDFGDTYDSLGTDLENTVTNIATTTTNSDTITDTISDFTDDLSAIESSVIGYQPLQQELLAKLIEIKSIVQDTKIEMVDILVPFAESTPAIIQQITDFQSDVNSQITNIQGTINTGFTDSTTNINNKFQVINDEIPDRFSEQLDIASDTIDTDTTNFESILSTFPVTTAADFGDASAIITAEFITSTTSVDNGASSITSLIPNNFVSSTGNINTQSGSTLNDVATKMDKLYDLISDDSQKDVESAIIGLRQTVKSSRDNMKYYLGLVIDYGYAAETQQLNINNDGVAGSGKRDGDVLIELTEMDIYIIGTIAIVMNLIWIVMIIYLIVDYCMPKYKI